MLFDKFNIKLCSQNLYIRLYEFLYIILCINIHIQGIIKLVSFKKSLTIQYLSLINFNQSVIVVVNNSRIINHDAPWVSEIYPSIFFYCFSKRKTSFIFN